MQRIVKKTNLKVVKPIKSGLTIKKKVEPFQQMKNVSQISLNRSGYFVPPSFTTSQ